MIALVLLAAPLSIEQADQPQIIESELLQLAEKSYESGVSARENSTQARPLFIKAASAYDELWKRGHHNADLARNRAQAHLLSGNLVEAIRAYRLGLRVAPDDKALQSGLKYAREQVAYPLTGNLAESCRPRERFTLFRYASANFWLALTGGLYLLGLLALTRAWMTRYANWSITGVVLMGSSIALGSFLKWEEKRFDEDNHRSLVVIAGKGAELHRGNGDEFPLRFTTRLPAGVELAVLNERGGWLQVELPGGEIGWVNGQRVVGIE